MADRRVGEHTLDVALEQRRDGAEQQRDQAGAAHQREPQVRARQDRPQSGQQEHARLHHGGRVQIGRNRGGRGHGMRQPEVERKLRAFGESADEQQHQQGRIPGVRAHGVARGQEVVEFVAADDLADEQHCGEQAQATRGRDRERHAGAAPRFTAVIPVRDEHERGEAGELPEHRELYQVARQHDAQHRAHEGEQEREETRHGIRGRHVVAGIEHHQRPHARHEQREHPGQSIEPQAERKPPLRQPGKPCADHAAIADVAVQSGREHRCRQRERACQRRRAIARVPRQHRGAQAADERQQKDHREDQGWAHVGDIT